MDPIDLRSDTVTRPTPAMRAAMASAEVGDDQYGEDPTMNRLQSRIAELLGKEAALFVPTGTMANQISLRLLTRPGDDVVIGGESHIAWHEAGASGANAGVQFMVASPAGRFTADEFDSVVKPSDKPIFAPTTLVVIENTHNRSGGIVFPQADVLAVVAAARAHNCGAYLDGARLFNAAVATGLSLAELAAPFDLVSVALSKGLGCPVGSLIAGPRDLMRRALALRIRMGGSMRQSGILAAAGHVALDAGFGHFTADHANARLIAERLASTPAKLDLATVQTNIVRFELPAPLPDAATVAARAAAQGVRISVFAPRVIRVTTHRDVTEAQCRRAAEVVAAAITQP